MSKSSKYHLEDGVLLVHEGSKAFWQTRTNVEIILALHLKLDCIEVIIIDSDDGTEFKRFYLNSKLLQSKLDQNDYDRKLSEKKEAFLRQRKSFDAHELSSQVKNTMIGQYVISRLSIQKDSVSGTKIVALKPNFGDVSIVSDEGETLDVVIHQPIDIEMVKVVQTKKASMDDFKKALTKLQTDTMALNQACDSAGKLAGLAQSSVSGFQEMIANRNLMFANCSEAKLRWKKAVRRVIINNYIEAVRSRLNKGLELSTEKVPITEIKKNISLSPVLDSSVSKNKREHLPALSPTSVSGVSSDKKFGQVREVVDLPILSPRSKVSVPILVSISASFDSHFSAQSQSTGDLHFKDFKPELSVLDSPGSGKGIRRLSMMPIDSSQSKAKSTLASVNDSSSHKKRGKTIINQQPVRRISDPDSKSIPLTSISEKKQHNSDDIQQLDDKSMMSTKSKAKSPVKRRRNSTASILTPIEKSNKMKVTEVK